MDTRLWIVSIPGEEARIEVADYSAKSEPNAHLIAAAPDLLAALVEIAHGCLTPAGFIDLAKIDRVARAAIAKARGGK